MIRWLSCLPLALLPVMGADGAAPVRVTLAEAPAPDASRSVGGAETPPALRLGDRVHLVVRLVAEPGYRVGAPEMAEADDGFVLVLDPSAERGPFDADGEAVEIPVEVVPFRLGEVSFPGVRVPWMAPDGTTGEARTDPWPLVVVATVDDVENAEPADIRGPIDLPVPWPWWALPLALVVLVLLGGALWALSRRRRPLPVAANAPAADPFAGLGPDAWALQALDRLVADRVLAQQGNGPFHDRLAEIVRRYVDGRYGIDTAERTTTEILAAFQARIRPLPGPRERLTRVLGHCDLVKFGRFAPVPHDALEMVEAARRLVDETRPATSATSLALEESA